MPTIEELNRGFELGEWEVLPARGVFRRGEQEEHPEPLVFGVLLALARRDGDLVTRDELVSELWDGRPMGDEPINRSLSQLRGHLGDRDRPYQYVETLTRRGYRLKKRVRLMHPAEQLDRVSPKPPLQSRLWQIVATIGALTLVAAVIWTLRPELPRSMGVLPFANGSGNADDQYLVFGFKDELMQTLHNIPNFVVINGRVTYDDEELTDIAKILNVDTVLEGTVQRSGDTLKVSYEISNGSNGAMINSGDITGPLEDFFALQERLAKIVLDDLFGPSAQTLISSSRPANFGAYERYMRGLFVFQRRGQQGNLENAIELFQDTIRLDGQFGPAYLQLATAYALLPEYRNAPLEEMNRAAIDTVEEGIDVDDSIRDAGNAVFGFVFHKQKNWKQAEQAYVRATRAEIVDSNAFNWYSRMLASVGRLDKALDQVIAAQEMDPTSAVINSRLAFAYTWMDNRPMAYDFYERSEMLGAGGTTHVMGYALLLARDGKLDEAYAQVKAAVESAETSANWVDPLFAAFADPAASGAALNAVDVAVAEDQITDQAEFVVRGLLGDLDGAMRVARRLEDPGEAFEMDLLFIPEMQPLRERADFLDLMDALGISQYWEDNGCTWTSAAVQCPDS
jgi:DNA-binding winged helix-turn-helix (wHTH) protein/TolB-like protein/tetratricopeptide (TPR) repeat protein